MEESEPLDPDCVPGSQKRKEKLKRPSCGSLEGLGSELKRSGHWPEPELITLGGLDMGEQLFVSVSSPYLGSPAPQPPSSPLVGPEAFPQLHQDKAEAGVVGCGLGGGGGEPPAQYHVTMMEEKLQPIEQQLQYLLKKAEEFQTHLVYRDRIHNEEFARAVPIFVKTCQPYFAFLESTARSPHSDTKPLPEYIQKRLLQFSQQLASSLEQLVLMYASFGFISLEETDPCSICYFYRGEFRLRQWLNVSIFRYCMPVPYTAARLPRLLFKKIRWNVDINQGTSFGDLNSTCTEYYFLCYKEAGEASNTDHQPSTKPANTKTRRLWSIGRWVQVEPSPGEVDLLCWFLYKQPRADYQLLLTLGFEEPSQITATDLLVNLLINRRPGETSPNCPPQPRPPLPQHPSPSEGGTGEIHPELVPLTPPDTQAFPHQTPTDTPQSSPPSPQ